MHISATIRSNQNQLHNTVQTNNQSQQLQIAAKSSGDGSSVNGGELLLLALATCFCNDIYREAAKRNINIISVEVKCSGDFGGEGEAGSNFKYCPHIVSDSTQDVIEELIQYTDKVAEIHNTLRKGLDITLTNDSNV